MPAAGLAGIPYQDPNFRNAVQLAIASSGKIANVYKTVSRKPSEDTRKEADAMAKYPIVEERNIGMAGISGAGKSSLICSLLQDAGIAIRDGGGRAMTCFPVHYRYKLAEHTAKYNLRCVFPDGKAFAERIAKLQEDLNAPYHIEKNELPPTEYEILEKDAGAAEATLTALFGKMDGFSLERLIWGDGRTTKEKTKPCLLNWATKLKLPDGTKEGIWSSEEKCTKDLQKALQKFQLNGLWPLIESLSIYLDAPLLKNGVVLIDLPGSHDTNMARVKIAEETQAKCDDIFMVAPIGRAVDSPVLQKFVEDNMSRPDFGSLPTQTVTAVFTNAATIDATIYKYADQDALQAANDALAILEADDDASAKKVRQVEHQIKSLIMQGRNQHVIADATSAYGSKLDKGCFHVFCVDNTMFMERKTQEAAELSGIPKLQEHVASLPAKTLFKLHNSFISTRLDATLASFETWVASCRPRPGKTQSVLPTPDLNGYVEQLRGWDATISGVFESCVKSPILEADMQKSIREETSEVALEWRKIHYGYFAALCRREGIGIDAVITPKSRRGGKAAPESDNAVKKSTKINNMSPATTRNLNKELCQCFGESTKECWLQLDAEVKSSLEDLDAEISLPFETYLETCKKLGAPKPILRSLTARTENLSDVLTAIRKRFLSGLSVIKNDVVRGSTTSYVRQYMLAAYDEAIGQRGKCRCHFILQTHVLTKDRQRCIHQEAHHH